MAQAKTTVREILKKSDICMLTTMLPDGKHVSRPMSLQQSEFDGDLWFLIYDNSNKAKQVKKHANVNVAFSNSGQWLSVSGKAEVMHDKEKAKELWKPVHKAWFPEGLETPHLGVLKVHADSAEYWDSPSNKAVQLLGMAKAAVTGKKPDGFDNKSVGL